MLVTVLILIVAQYLLSNRRAPPSSHKHTSPAKGHVYIHQMPNKISKDYQEAVIMVHVISSEIHSR